MELFGLVVDDSEFSDTYRGFISARLYALAWSPEDVGCSCLVEMVVLTGFVAFELCFYEVACYCCFLGALSLIVWPKDFNQFNF